MARHSEALGSGWRLRATGGPIPENLRGIEIAATVPGCVHTDLLRAGLIPDPYLDDNESALAWIGRVDWEYSRSLTVAPEEATGRHDLVFEGVDTVAQIRLDGVVLADVANQHRTYRFDVSRLLTPGDHELTVAFQSPVRYATAQSTLLGARPRPYPLPYEAIRKSACNFGWDWGIATFTSGLWRPVSWERWSTARWNEVRVVATPVGSGGAVAVTGSIVRDSDAPLTVVVEVDGHRATQALAAGETAVDIRVDLPHVERWWPVGHGAQPLSTVSVVLLEDDVEIDRRSRRVGFRDVRWDSEPDDEGTPFTLHVNDRPIWVKGANWIPDDALPVRVTPERYRDRLEQAVAANLNLIRVWGGGIYEDDAFYDACDELGLLTWQDFLFACAAYPEEEPIRSEVEAEARDNVTRLGHHASLVLFTGNNENLWGFEEWGWQLRLDGRTWGAYYYHDLLPRIVGELAPQVPYSPGSPFSPGGQAANSPDHGTMHIWDLWNQRDWPHYREYRPRFVAEFGWQGPPTWSTLVASISDDPLTPESPGMLVHQKATEGNVKLGTGLVRHYRVPDDMEDWHWAMQLNQANAITCALEHFRASAPRTMGAVVWQFNDCWPVTSWAAVDGSGRPKPLFHAMRAAFRPRHIGIHPTGDGLTAAISNDTATPWDGAVVARRVRYDGTVVAQESFPVEIPAFGRDRVDLPSSITVPGDAAAELVIVEQGASRAVWFFGEPRDSALPRPEATVEVEGATVRVTAHTLLRDLTLLVDKVEPDCRVDEALVTLLPGESFVFHLSQAPRDGEALRHPRVLRSANQLVAR